MTTDVVNPHMEETDAEVNARHKADLQACIARHPAGTTSRHGKAFEEMMTLHEVHRKEWAERVALRTKVDRVEDAEAWKALRLTLARKGDKVKHRANRWVGTVASVRRQTYLVVRPGGQRLELPHSDWELLD